MRLALRHPEVTLPPEQPVKVTFDVTNTLEVIDGVVAGVSVPPGMTVTATPELLPLFPDTVGQVTLELRVSSTFPAGTYNLPVELRSSAVSEERLDDSIQVVVPPVAAGELSVLPAVRSVRHRARYTIVCENTGNTTLEVALAASDPQHSCIVQFESTVLTVEPGGSATTAMSVRRRRRLLGSETSIEVAVVGTSPGLDLETTAVLRHRPVVARGVRVAAVLVAIIAVWAAVFVVALDRAMSNDPLTKAVPASFYASLGPKADRAKLQALDGGADLDLASADGSTPAGAVPKTGVVVGVGGTIAGTVTAKSTAAGIGRISVNAYQDTPSGQKLVASAATGTDGSYSIVGLLPGPYTVEFDAQGYRTEWYPAASSESTARTVTVEALQTSGGISSVVTGEPGSISGTVETGQTPAPPVTVTVEAEQGATTTPIAKVVSNSAGNYTIPNLPAPNTYDLSFSAKGYTVATDSEEIAGGEQEIANTVTLSAGTGTMEGTVTSGGKPLGGVSITATANGKTYTTATPTSGDVGSFTLAGLPSPATYLLTFTEAGYGSRTVGEALGPGQVLSGLQVSMSGGAGTITGQVESANGTALGGVSVTAYSGSTSSASESLTAGQVGEFEISGLRTPGTYTLSFSLAGYTSRTISVPLGSSGSANNIDVTLASAAGSIKGTVVVGNVSGAGLPGVTVSLTDGLTLMSTTSTSQPPGEFSFADLPAGNYTLTFSLSGYNTATYLVTLGSGQTASIAPVMSADS